MNEELAWLVGPPHADTTLCTAHGNIRLVEGRALVPLSVARQLLRPGWTIAPVVTLEDHEERKNA